MSEDQNWDPKLDSLLLQWCQLYYEDWKKITNRFNREYKLHFSPKFLRDKAKTLERGTKIMCNVALNDEWDLKILDSIKILGLNWNKIAQNLDFENPIKLKNRYYNSIKKKVKYQKIIKNFRQD